VSSNAEPNPPLLPNGRGRPDNEGDGGQPNRPLRPNVIRTAAYMISRPPPVVKGSIQMPPMPLASAVLVNNASSSPSNRRSSNASDSSQMTRQTTDTTKTVPTNNLSIRTPASSGIPEFIEFSNKKIAKNGGLVSTNAEPNRPLLPSRPPPLVEGSIQMPPMPLASGVLVNNTIPSPINRPIFPLQRRNALLPNGPRRSDNEGGGEQPNPPLRPNGRGRPDNSDDSSIDSIKNIRGYHNILNKVRIISHNYTIKYSDSAFFDEIGNQIPPKQPYEGAVVYVGLHL
jgi:hypothetical protein